LLIFIIFDEFSALLHTQLHLSSVKGSSGSDAAESSGAAMSGHGPRIGLDFDTACLANKSEADIARLLTHLAAELSASPSLPSTPTQMVVTIAANAFTMPLASTVASWAQERGMIVVATEVLRTHKASPGQVSGAYDHEVGRGLDVDVM
jgi:hypothetical protein